MKALFNITLIFCFSTQSYAVGIDTLKLLQNTKWEFGRNYFGDDLVTLVKASSMEDTLDLNEDDKKMLKFMYKIIPSITFNDSSAVYRQFIDCPVGETLYFLSKYRYKNGKFTIYHRWIPWEDWGKLPLDSTTYEIKKITPTMIVFATEKYKGIDPTTIEDFNLIDKRFRKKENSPDISKYSPFPVSNISIDEEKKLQKEREQCVFSDSIKGDIKILRVFKVKTSAESLYQHDEYQILVSFYPLNFEKLPREERDFWQGPFLFTFAPTSLNLNVTKEYIRTHYLAGSGIRYSGVALKKIKGVCNDIIFYSDELPLPLEIRN